MTSAFDALPVFGITYHNILYLGSFLRDSVLSFFCRLQGIFTSFHHSVRKIMILYFGILKECTV